MRTSSRSPTLSLRRGSADASQKRGQMTEDTKRDLEMNRPALEQIASMSIEHVSGMDAAPTFCTADDSRLQSVDDSSPRVQEFSPEVPLCVKEDDSKVGSGSGNASSGASLAPVNGGVGVMQGASTQMAAIPILPQNNKRPAHSPKVNHTDRKRRRREEQNVLVSKLDRILPDKARKGGFKGAGPRSAGVWGRSFFNVLSDTIHHLKELQSAGSACPSTSKPKTLSSLGLSYTQGFGPLMRVRCMPRRLSCLCISSLCRALPLHFLPLPCACTFHRAHMWRLAAVPIPSMRMLVVVIALC